MRDQNVCILVLLCSQPRLAQSAGTLDITMRWAKRRYCLASARSLFSEPSPHRLDASARDFSLGELMNKSRGIVDWTRTSLSGSESPHPHYGAGAVRLSDEICLRHLQLHYCRHKYVTCQNMGQIARGSECFANAAAFTPRLALGKRANSCAMDPFPMLNAA